MWFCLNRSLFEEDSGCDDFFKYFGGESIYRVALGDQGLSNVKTVLEEIGEPLLVTALIPFNQLARFQQDRISDFIARNHSEPCEAFVKDNIPPQKIVKIEKWNSLG